MNNEKVWKSGEELAAKYMKEMGYKIITTNYKEKEFELDIVAVLSKKKQLKKLREEFKQKVSGVSSYDEAKTIRTVFENQKKMVTKLLVITEVKARTSNKFGKGYDAVSETKQSKLVLGAKFLQKQRKFAKCNVRFDVASIDAGVVTYIENAFETKNS